MKQGDKRSPGSGGCPAERFCPLRTFCDLYADEASDPLHPSSYVLDKGDIFVSNPSSQNRVYIFKTGAYLSMGELNSGEEVPFAIFGQGITSGLVELYTPQTVSDTYHMRTLLSGTICSVPASPLKRKLESLPQYFSHRILSSAFTNQSTAAFTLTAIKSQSFLSDRVRGLLLYLRDLSRNEETKATNFEITHEEIAMIVAANRMAITRVLKKLQTEGLVEYSYKSITLTKKMIEEYPEVYLSYFIELDDSAEVHDNFAEIYLEEHCLSEPPRSSKD